MTTQIIVNVRAVNKNMMNIAMVKFPIRSRPVTVNIQSIPNIVEL